ncbi:MAG: alginate export family protein [Myxococcales bacterium]|nr:alginate export family protein [Myxococcales bacterium]
MRTSAALVSAALLASGLLLVPRTASAQAAPEKPETLGVGDWQLRPLAEIRTRGELRHDAPDQGGTDGFGRAGARVRDAWAVHTRARLGLGVERGPVRGQITLQDTRIWGGPAAATTFGASGTGAYEAYLEARTSAARPWFVRVGRQAVVWGEGRLLGAADWSPTGRSLDAVRGRLTVGPIGVEALGAILASPAPSGASYGDAFGAPHTGTQLFGGLVDWTVDPLLKLEAYFLGRVARGDGGTPDGSRLGAARSLGETYTGALRVSGDAKGWRYGAEGAYQLGTATALGAGGADVSAWAAYAHVGRRFDELVLTPTIQIGGLYASGDDRGAKYKQFDPLLPDPFTYGAYDAFGFSNHVGGNARVTVSPWSDATLGADYRYARLANGAGEWINGYVQGVGSPGGPGALIVSPPPNPVTVSEELGHEIDAFVTVRPWAPLELQGGWSAVFYGDGAKAILATYRRGFERGDGTIQAPNLGQLVYLSAKLRLP